MANRKAQQHAYYLANREKFREWQRRRSIKRRENAKTGLCIHCEKERLPASGSLCEIHWFRCAASNNLGEGSLAMANALQDLLVAQNYTCPYTGTRLTPGVNCWLDHIVPVSRDESLQHELSNVEWVSREANLAKGAMTKDEFLALCAMVHDHTVGKVATHGE